MFTKEQIEEIQRKLAANGLKDSDFERILEAYINGQEYVTVVANGQNKRILLADIDKYLFDKNLPDLAEIRAGAEAGASAYQKPEGGIPKSDLANAVKQSLNKADTSLQPNDMDKAPKQYSKKPVESNGIWEAIQEAAGTGEMNKIDEIQVNGVTQEPVNKVVDITVPPEVTADTVAEWGFGTYSKPADGIPATDIADGVIPDVSGFITKSVDDLLNYYLKSDTYTKDEVIQIVAAVTSPIKVAELPEASAQTMHKLYLVPSTNPQTENALDEYITIEDDNTYSWEQIGSTEVDLSGLVESDDIDKIVECTQAEYDAIVTKDPNTIYIISNSTVPSNKVGIASLEQTTTSSVSEGNNVWTCTLTNGNTYTLTVKNGAQGNSGYSGAAGELEVVNNLTDGGATAALSAQQGVVLDGKISQLGQKVDGLVFDVTEENTGSPTFASLSVLLSDANLSTLIPTSVRTGGMSIRFIRTSDNKYVQYRYMGTATTGTPNPFLDTANWQGVDDVAIAGSGNLVKSSGIVLSKAEIITGLGFTDFTLDADRAYYSTGGVKQYDATVYARTLPIEVSEDEVITYKAECNSTNCVIAALDSNGNFVAESSVAGTTSSITERTYTVPSGIKYLVFCNRYVSNPYVAKQGKYIGNVELESKKIPNSNKVAEYVNGQNNYPGILPLETLKPEYCRQFNGFFGISNNTLRLYFGDGRNHVVCRVTPGQTLSLTSPDSSHQVEVFLFSSYYNKDNGDISGISLTTDSTKYYRANASTVSFTVPQDTYYLAFNIYGNYTYPSKVVVNGNDVTNSFLKIISDYNTEMEEDWVLDSSINFSTGELVSISGCKLSKYLPVTIKNHLVTIYTEFRDTNGYNYGFALYASANEDSFIANPEILYAENQTTNGKVVIFIPDNANYIRVTAHPTRNPNPHIEYSAYTQSRMLAGGAEEIPFVPGMAVSIGNSASVGTTFTPNIVIGELTKAAIVNCTEGEVYTINGVAAGTRNYVVVDENNEILLVSSDKVLRNHVITIPTGGVRLYIGQMISPASMCYKGNTTIGLMSLWQGTETEFDNLASYPEKSVYLDNESNILNIDHDSILTKAQKEFDKVDYSNDLVNYAHSEASYFAKGDWPRPILIPVSTNRTDLYSNAKFKLYDEDNNLVYEETISTPINKYVVKVWNLQPNMTYHWELLNSTGATRYSYGAITPQGCPRFVKVMEGTNRVENVRDLGGWKVGWDKAVRYGLVYRGSDMNWGHTINEAGIAVMKDFLGIGCDIDMRSPSEYSPFLTESPLGSDVEWVNYPANAYTIINGTGMSGTHYANAIKKIVSNLSNGIVTYFHCKSGADRTGTLSLLILGLLGVSESDLSKEYEFTIGRNRNAIDTVNNRDIPHLIATIKTYTGDTLQDKIAAWALEYGVTQTEINTLREKMIIEVNP